MPVNVTEINRTENGIYMNLTCGKKSACICINDWEFRVIVQHAAHKVWRKSGRGFATMQEALASYKSPEVKCMIYSADQLNH